MTTYFEPSSGVLGWGYAVAIIVGAGATAWPGICCEGDLGLETNQQLPMPTCSISSLTIRTTSAQPATGTLVFTVRKNGVNTALVITIPAGAAAGVFTNTTDQVVFSSTDRLSITVVNHAATDSAALRSMSLLTSG